VNAGFLGSEHWTQDPEIGGGRILGEVCHFIDLLTFVAGSLPVRVETRALANNGRYSDDNLTLQLGFANGSAGAITYAANGDKSYSKERLEVFGAGKVGVLQDFRHLELSRDGRNQTERSRLKQDKGHRACWEAFLGAVKNGTPSLVPFEETIAVSLTTLLALQSRNLGEPRDVDTASFISDAHSEGSPQH
jgi:predicted dehydrogenase